MAGIIIIGAGKAGASAALALRRGGYTGALTLLGAEPHAPYDRPPLSKAALLEPEPPAPAWVLTPEQAAAQNISLRRGAEVTSISAPARRVHLADGTTLPYSKLLLATGATPRQLPGAAGVLYLRTYEDALALRTRLAPQSHVAIIGGGFIGMELAAAARQRGAAVTLVESAPRVLMRGVPAAVAAVIAARHAQAGVNLLTGVGIARIARAGAQHHLHLADGRLITADLLIAGIGAAPQTRLAAAAGLALDNGIAVDEWLRTSDPDIYAAGDCCAFPHPLFGGRRIRLEAWRNAQDQGEAVAQTMLGGTQPFQAVPWFWSDQYDLCLQVTGLAEPDAPTIARHLPGGTALHFQCDAQGRLIAAAAAGGMRLGKEIRLAEMLIAQRARPSPAALAAPDVPLKSLLAPMAMADASSS